MTDGLLPGADRDLVRILQNRLNRTFEQIILSTKVVSLANTGNAMTVTFEGAGAGEGKAAAEQTFDRVLVAVGRTPNSQDLGLETTMVQVLPPRGFIEVNEKRQTADPHIYAIGDVAGEPMLAHKASKEAKVAAAVIAGEKAAFDVRAIPGVVFTDPEIAWTGLTETQARAKGLDITIGKFPWGASGRATAMGRNDGLTKIITDTKSNRIVGAGIVGIGAGELIAEPTLAIEMGATAEDVGLTIHAHPTLAETVGEASELTYGTTTHTYQKRRG
jgi:dihydrolipoamide dehydrogenase